MAHNVMEPRQTVPVLENALLEAQGDTLRMTATDLEVSVRVTGPAKVVKPKLDWAPRVDRTYIL
jgi:DNA polymerase-3 subunit beta